MESLAARGKPSNRIGDCQELRGGALVPKASRSPRLPTKYLTPLRKEPYHEFEAIFILTMYTYNIQPVKVRLSNEERGQKYCIAVFNKKRKTGKIKPECG